MLIVKVVDIFDFNGSWLPGSASFVGNNKVLSSGEIRQYFTAKLIKKNKLIHWMKREAKELGLKSVDVFLMSAQKGQGIREIAEAIQHYREGKDVYVVDEQTLAINIY